MRGLKYLVFFCLICLTVIVGVNDLGNSAVQAADNTADTVDTAITTEPLPTVGSYENLIKILQDAQRMGNFPMQQAVGMNGAMMEKAQAPAAAASNSATTSGPGSDYSQTNVQVQGVDEADTVKTDGEYIYKITNHKLVVIKAYQADELKVASTLTFDQNTNPVEMYVDNKYLTVILNQSYPYLREPLVVDAAGSSGETKIIPQMPPAGVFENSVKVQIYDLENKADLKLVRQVEIDGGYVSSRKIENNLYLVNNKYIPVYLLNEQDEELPTPAYRDSADGNEIKRIGYPDIGYFPGSPEANYLIIAAINLDNMADKKTEIKTYLGSGQNIYCSQDNLYVAVPEYKFDQAKPLSQPADTPEGALVKRSILPMPLEENTGVYKFSLKQGSTAYLGKGTVPGRILNQFSMDENNGYFRLATTQNKYLVTKSEMTNNVYVLDPAMKITGQLENIAPGEKIYSVRFLGDRGYMVTFKTVDPLFVLDLKNPSAPQILGELKIPGYSNYLHPYDENHIIGFGKETVEIEEQSWSGQGTVKNAYYLGMKVALFDVSDVNNPKEKFKIEIGDRGTDSELFQNHKALLFSKEKNIMAFPVTVCEIDKDAVDKKDYLSRQDPRLAYGMPIFQGALVYNISENGFSLKGMITHQASGKVADLQRANQYDYERDVSRILYIDNTLYTVSDGYLKANDLGTLQEKAGITIGE